MSRSFPLYQQNVSHFHTSTVHVIHIIHIALVPGQHRDWSAVGPSKCRGIKKRIPL